MSTIRIRLMCLVSCAALGLPSLGAPDQEAAGKPMVKNILFIMSDDLKASVLPAYGNGVCKTPNLDRLAASSMVFERAYCQGLACLPSRPSMLRSIYPRAAVTAPTIGEHLQEHGMHTARVGKIFHMGVPNAQRDGSNGSDVAACWTERHNTISRETFTPGLYRLMNRGIATRELKGRQGAGTKDRMYTSVEADQEDGSDQADYMVATKAIELLQQRKAAAKPFFLGVGFVRPHYPMVTPKKYFDMYSQAEIETPPQVVGDRDDIPAGGLGNDGRGMNTTEEGRRRMWQAYYASVSFMDEQLGRVIAELDRLGLRDTTAIVFTTDHGYHLGEHGFWQKVNLHEEVARVPLMVSAPGMKPGRTQSLVELVDLYPTCSDLLGLPIPAALQGKSLARILRDPAASVRDTALSVHHTRPYAAIRAADWHYMNYGDEGEELYDMTKDPHQYTNAVTDAEYAPLLKKARAAFQARIEEAGLKPPRRATARARKKPAAAKASQGQPNIILIMADDMGYECVRANGGTSFQTPALDALAKTGVRFEHCYSQPLCTPSRVQIMTGIYNVRNYVKFGVLDRKQRTFAHALKAAGYATCIAGKWQLGNEGDAPQHFGFDESCLWQHTRGARDKKKRDTRYPNPHVEVNGKPVDYTNGEYGPDVVSDFLCEFMARNKNKPFLAYYPMILPHNPFVPTPDSKDPKCRDNQTNFQDMVAHIDKVVGKVTAKLDALDIRENTLVLFTGDNGTAGAIWAQLNGRKVQGGKGKMTDAGTRVPLIANWPGTIPEGRVLDDLVDFSDFLPTLCDAVGISAPPVPKLDGRSFLPQLKGQPGAPRDWAYCWYLSKKKTVEEWARTQRYKLYRTGKFYDISKDALEKTPLKKLSPEAQQARTTLQQALDQYQGVRPAALAVPAGEK